MQRLAALVPRARLHIIRFHGVLAPHDRLRAVIVPRTVDRPCEPADEHMRRFARMSWVRLGKRIFAIDIEYCPNCGGELKIIAAIEDPGVIVRILSHLGLSSRAPPRAPVRLPELIQAA